MPIRLNLLAEQQAAEDLRRRDPVKRAIWVAGLIVGVMVIWSGRLQIKLMGAMSEVNRYESEWKKLEPEYNKVTELREGRGCREQVGGFAGPCYQPFPLGCPAQRLAVCHCQG